MYKSYNVTPPKFVEEKRFLFIQKMREQLIKSSTWIGVSSKEYQVKMNFKYEDIRYEE